MQATTRFHDGIPNPILQEADFVLHDPIAFHTANRMFNPHADGRNPPIHRFLRGSELPSTRFLLGLENRNPRQDESLEALILIQTTARGERIASLLRHALIRRFAFTGVAQKENVTALIDDKQVFQRVTFLLATVIFLLIFWIFWALDRAFGPIVHKRGVVAAPSASGRANSAANSSAVRAGRSPWLANA